MTIGVQIVGGLLEDKTTHKFAELIEREFGGSNRRRIIKRDRAEIERRAGLASRPRRSLSATIDWKSISPSFSADNITG